jgi:hypothetical protein
MRGMRHINTFAHSRRLDWTRHSFAPLTITRVAPRSHSLTGTATPTPSQIQGHDLTLLTAASIGKLAQLIDAQRSTGVAPETTKAAARAQLLLLLPPPASLQDPSTRTAPPAFSSSSCLLAVSCSCGSVRTAR